MVSCACQGTDFASRANRRVVLQSLGTTADQYGGRGSGWSDAATVWAIVEPMTGREPFLSGQLQSRVDARITIRYQDFMADTTSASKNRVRYGSRLYNINAVKNLSDDMKTEGTQYQQLLCTEGEPS